MKHKFFISVIVIVVIQTVGLQNAFAYTNTYPHPDASHCACQRDSWDFYKRQCTSYAAWKANESGTSFSNNMRGPNNTVGQFGNAANWNDNASNIGFNVGTTAATGSIAVWEPNTGGAYAAGHVAWVETVNTNSTIDISEYNWNDNDGYYNTRTISINNLPGSYIYLGNSCGGSNVSITNKTITNSLACSATQNITIGPETLVQPGTNEVRFYIQ